MKIINLKTENFKKIKAVEITPTDNTIIITGKNGQGKTSLLDSIFVALTGKNRELKKPIRNGEDKAVIEVDMGKYKVIRTFTAKTNNLKVVNKDGSLWPKPQAMLDDIVGELSFDPLEFIRKKEKEQRDILLNLIGVDVEKIVQERKAVYDRRYENGIEGKAMTFYSDEEVKWAKSLPRKKQDIEKIKEDLLEENNKKNQAYNLSFIVDELNSNIKELEEKLTTAKKELIKKKKELSLIKFSEKKVKDLTTKVDEAIHKNDNIEKAGVILKSNEKVEEKRKSYTDLTKRLENIDKEKKKLLDSAIMPIDGLKIDEDGVIYNKVPLSQVSMSEKIKVGVAISMAMNPELKVIRIDDGSLLDSDNLKAIQDMVKEQDYQIWIESVDNKEMGFYIEDGELIK